MTGGRERALRIGLAIALGAAVSAGSASSGEAAAESGAARDADPAPAHRPFWKPLLVDHWRHVALVVGASLVNEGVDRSTGPRGTPLIFSSPPGFDRTIRDRFRRGPGDTGPHGFVESHATSITRALTAAAVVASNGSRWRDDVTDFLGLWEAQRFNVAATGLMKNIVGRERPELEFAKQDGASAAEIARLERSDKNHQSFYSFHASAAFTTLAYADFVLSKRLAAHPAARFWVHAGVIGLGGYIAWSRVLQDQHYFSDVAVGSVAGALVGRSFYSFNHPDGLDHRLSWDPIPERFVLAPPAPVPGGFMISARIGL